MDDRFLNMDPVLESVIYILCGIRSDGGTTKAERFDAVRAEIEEAYDLPLDEIEAELAHAHLRMPTGGDDE